MPIELSTEKAVCSRCGQAFGQRKGNFQTSYASMHKGIGFLPICRNCCEALYAGYLSKCNNQKDAVRQMCRKLDLYWNERAYDSVSAKSTTRTIMSQYITRINTSSYAGKSYDDTLKEEGTLWSFTSVSILPDVDNEAKPDDDLSSVGHDVIDFWGTGYSADMYRELEKRRQYWMNNLPSGLEMDAGTEALIRQICSLELDINRDRAAGRSVEKSVTALNTILGSMNLKPTQRKQDEIDSNLASTPLGVWLYRYENERPLPEVDDSLKDVNKLKRYVFTWMGHLCKMLGIKNAYAKLYEDEIARLRVDKPEYDDEDDESLMLDELEEADIGPEKENDEGTI